MANYRTSRILPITLVIIIIVIAVAALISLAQVVFFSGDSAAPTNTDVSRQALLDTSDGRSVGMTVRGPIVADESFDSYQIVISPINRVMRTFNGYLDRVVASETLPNTVAAYEEFVYALDRANFADGKQLEGERNDVRGICATGRLYEYSIIYKGEPVKQLWTSTCRGSNGSLDADVRQINDLFIKQIPNASDLINSIDL